MLCKWNNKAWITAHLFTIWFIKYFKTTVEVYCSEKKDSFQNITGIDYVSGQPRVLMGMYSGITNVFMLASTAFIPQPMGLGVISTFKSYLRNTFHKAIASRDNDSPEGS